MITLSYKSSLSYLSLLSKQCAVKGALSILNKLFLYATWCLAQKRLKGVPLKELRRLVTECQDYFLGNLSDSEDDMDMKMESKPHKSVNPTDPVEIHDDDMDIDSVADTSVEDDTLDNPNDDIESENENENQPNDATTTGSETSTSTRNDKPSPNTSSKPGTIQNLSSLSDKKINSMMVAPREENIPSIQREDVITYLKTYARQYDMRCDPNYYNDASIEKLQNELIRSSIELRSFLATRPPTCLDANTTNDQLIKMSYDNGIQILQDYVRENGLTIDMKHITSRGQLVIQECRKIRDQLRKDQGLPPFVTTTPSWKIKKVVDRSNSEFFRNTINLNGCNLDKYISNHHSSPVDPRSHMVTDSTYNPTTTFKENDFYVRTFFPMSKKNSHAPTIVRKIFRALQQADPTFLLKPFDRNNKSSNDDISIPDKIPDDEEKFKKYVQGVSITRANKLRFSMRVTNTMSFNYLRAILGDYEIESGTNHNNDCIVSKEIFAAGYLLFVHLTWINRDDLVQWVLKQTDIADMDEKIHVYP